MLLSPSVLPSSTTFGWCCPPFVPFFLWVVLLASVWCCFLPLCLWVVLFTQPSFGGASLWCGAAFPSSFFWVVVRSPRSFWVLLLPPPSLSSSPSSPVEANVSLHPHAKFKGCLLKFDAVCTVSSFSLVQGSDTYPSVLRTIVVHSCLERCPYLECAPVGGCRFRPNLGRMELGIFLFFHFFLCDGRTD